MLEGLSQEDSSRYKYQLAAFVGGSLEMQASGSPGAVNKYPELKGNVNQLDRIHLRYGTNFSPIMRFGGFSDQPINTLKKLLNRNSIVPVTETHVQGYRALFDDAQALHLVIFNSAGEWWTYLSEDIS